MKATVCNADDHGRHYQMVFFLCPGCDMPHAIEVGRWTWNGSEESPTFSPSILVNGRTESQAGKRCHSFVTDGKIAFCSDSDHALAGKTVDLPDVPDWLAD